MRRPAQASPSRGDGWPALRRPEPRAPRTSASSSSRCGGPGAPAPPAQPGHDEAEPWWQPGVTHYSIDIGEYTDQLHPDLPQPDSAVGLRPRSRRNSWRHLGGIIAAERGTPRPDHVPQQACRRGTSSASTGRSWAPRTPDNRADVHLHGGLVPWTSDGGPFAWWDPSGNTGPSFLNNSRPPAVPHPAANDAEYYYPNNQGARLIWYHDHSIGTTRLNAYAGIASAYVIYDDYELALGA